MLLQDVEYYRWYSTLEEFERNILLEGKISQDPNHFNLKLDLKFDSLHWVHRQDGHQIIEKPWVINEVDYAFKDFISQFWHSNVADFFKNL